MRAQGHGVEEFLVVDCSATIPRIRSAKQTAETGAEGKAEKAEEARHSTLANVSNETPDVYGAEHKCAISGNNL